MRKMSTLTQRLLKNIDYASVSSKRRANFLLLHEDFGHLNKLRLELTNGSIPMVYPVYVERRTLRQHLIDNRIYVAQYWPNVVDWTDRDDLEWSMQTRSWPYPLTSDTLPTI